MQHLIHGSAFKAHPTPDPVLRFPAMLAEDERRVLVYLAKNLASAGGKILDLGCYLGGSTVALATGVEQAGVAADPADPIIVSYDLFVANQFMVDHSLRGHGVAAGDSFRHVYRQLLGRHAPYVREVAGDIRQQQWAGGPIDLLFVDILWDWEINRHVISQFYTALIPGRSVIAHQDYIYSYYPWLPISMEYLCEKGYVEFGDFAPMGTVLFGVLRAIDADATGVDFRHDLTPDTQEKLLVRSANRFTGHAKVLLELSRVMLCLRSGRGADAKALFEPIATRPDLDPISAQHVAMVGQSVATEAA